tara:strand:+ start:635 stop:1297 length:663 start_codon:yes stop_codon:yes gene_type:complete
LDGDVAVVPALDCRPSGGGDRGVVLGESLVTDSATLVQRGDRDPRPGGTLGLDRGAVTAVTPDPSLGDPTGDVVAGLIRGCEGTRRMVPPELLSITGAGTCSTFSFTIISPSMSSSSLLSSSSFFCSVTVSVGTTACFTIVPVKGTVPFVGLTMVPVNGLTMVPVKTSSVYSSSFLISFCSSTTSLLGADAAAFVAGGAAGATVGSSAVTTRTSSIPACS